MMDRVEVLPQVLCPVCGALLLVRSDRCVSKKPKGTSYRDDVQEEKTYIIDCQNALCGDYRKVKFLKAQYREVEFKWVD